MSEHTQSRILSPEADAKWGPMASHPDLELDAFLRRLRRDLIVPAEGLTDLGTEINDPNRIEEFAEYYFTLGDESSSHRSDFAMAVWESIEQRWVDGQPTSTALAAVERVLVDAQHIEDFCFDFCNQVLWGGNNIVTEPTRRWMYALTSIDHEAIGSRGVRVLKSICRDA